MRSTDLPCSSARRVCFAQRLTWRWVFLVSASTAGAWAQGQPAAEALFRSGQEAAQAGEWGVACERFEESQRLESAPGTLLNLARCREELGQLASSWKRYRELIEKLPETDERRAYAQRREADLAPRVPRLLLIRPTEGKDIEVTLGDVTLSSAVFGVSLPVDPGHTTVTVNAPGHEPWVIEVSLEEGDRLEQRLELGPRIAPSASGATNSPLVEGTAPRQRPLSPAGWTALGIGAAGTAVGIFGLVWSAVEMGNVGAHCDAMGVCDAEGVRAGERGRAAVILSVAGLSVGAVGVTLGLNLRKETRDLEHPTGHAVRLRAVPTWGGAVLTLGGEL